MRAVSNTSPLIFLSKIERLPLLQKCFSEVFVPGAVHEEFLGILSAFMKVHAVSEKGQSFVQGSIGRLHKGELEAIVAAQELKADFVLMDDLLARRKAERLGVKPLGTIGILLLANQMKVLSASETKSSVHALVKDHGLFISDEILKMVLARVM